MKFKKDFLLHYLEKAPIPLAIERTLECNILSKKDFKRLILDIGCGEGLFAYILFDEKIDVGIEPNERELKRAKEYDKYHELIQCYGDNIPKETGAFNTIFSNSVLEHIEDLKPVLKEAHRLLADNGKFYITVPTDMFDKYTVIYRVLSALGLRSLTEKYRRFFNKFWRHYHYYNEKDWGEMLSKSGFNILESQEYGSNAICTSDDFLAPFSFLGFLNKKILNRWILFNKIRKIYIYPFSLLLGYVMSRYENGSRGGMIYFCLKKK